MTIGGSNSAYIVTFNVPSASIGSLTIGVGVRQSSEFSLETQLGRHVNCINGGIA